VTFDNIKVVVGGDVFGKQAFQIVVQPFVCFEEFSVEVTMR